MGLFTRSSKSKQDEMYRGLAKHYIAVESNSEFRSQRQLYDDFVATMCIDGVDADEMPNGFGEFGLTETNPIPCKTVFGSIAYLAKLMAPDGRSVQYRRTGSLGSSVSRHLVDVYEVSHPIGRSLGNLYISPYHKRSSQKAPKGFTLRVNYAEEQFIKYGELATALLAGPQK
jgi:hypothetical protein